MLIISVGDNENNRWKRNTEKKQQQQKTKARKNKGGKGYSERVRAK